MSAADTVAPNSPFLTAIAALVEAGDWDGVAAQAESALQDGDASGWPVVAQAACAFHAGALGQAVVLLRDLVARKAAPEGTRDVLAVLYCLAGDLARALDLGRDPAAVGGGAAGALFGGVLPAFADAVAAIEPKPLLRQGVAALAGGDAGRARFLIEQHLLVDGADTDALEPLAEALLALGHVDQALAVLRALVALAGPLPALLSRLAQALTRQGDSAQALAVHDYACAAQPDSAAAWGAMAADLRFVDPARSDVAARLDQWRAVVTAQVSPAAAVPVAAAERVTLGYLCAGIGVAECEMVARVMAAHDRDRFIVVCFGAETGDTVLRSSCDRWRAVGALDNLTLGALIRAEGVDVLIDAAGLAAPHRAPLLTRHVAPVQVAWLGLPALGAQPGADLHLAARPGEGRRVLETGRLLLGGGGLDAGPAPARGGVATLGVEAGPGMIDPAMVRLWATVLRALPAAVLCLRDGGWLDGAAAARLGDLFGSFGVADRVVVVAAEAGAFLRQVDLLLATYPAADTLALGQALAAGVPVLVRAGSVETDDLAAALAGAGLDDVLVAEDDRAYVAKAQALAGDVGRLAALRGRGAELVGAAPAFDPAVFVAGLEHAMLAALGSPAKG